MDTCRLHISLPYSFGLGLLLLPVLGIVRYSWAYPSVLGLFLLFILSPGVAQTHLWFRRKFDVAERLCLYFSFGMATACLVLFTLGLTGTNWRIGTVAIGYSVLVGSLLTATGLRLRGRFVSEVFGGAFPMFVLWCALGLAALLLLNQNSLLLTSDALFYLKLTIVRWMEQQEMSRLIRSGVLEIIAATRIYREGIQPLFLRISGVSAISQYLILVSLVGPCFLCAFYTFSRRVLEQPRFTRLSVIFFLAHFGGFWFNPVHFNYSWIVAWSLYLASISLLFLYLAERDRACLAGALVLGAATFLIHGSIFFMTCLSYISFISFKLAFDWGSSRWRKAAPWILACMLFGPYLVYLFDLFLVRIPLLDSLPNYRQGPDLLGLFRPFGTGYMVVLWSDPLRFLGAWGALSLLAAPFVLMKRRKELGRNSVLFLSSNLYVPLLVMTNPFLVTFLSSLSEQAQDIVFNRLCFTMPYISVIALWVDSVLGPKQGCRLLPRLRRSAVTVILLVCITAVPVVFYRLMVLLPFDWGYRVQPYVLPLTGLPNGPFRYHHPALIRTMKYIREHIPETAPILTDPLTAELFPFYAENPVLETWRPDLMWDWIRQSRTMVYLGPDFDGLKLIRTLTHKKIDYLLVNTSFDSSMAEKYFAPFLGRGMNPIDAQKFLLNSRLFHLEHREDGIFLFRFLKENIGKIEVLPIAQYLVLE